LLYQDNAPPSMPPTKLLQTRAERWIDRRASWSASKRPYEEHGSCVVQNARKCRPSNLLAMRDMQPHCCFVLPNSRERFEAVPSRRPGRGIDTPAPIWTDRPAADAAEVDAFVKTRLPCLGEVVDGLLARPAMAALGRHGLDLARYADAAGSKGPKIGCSPGGMDYVIDGVQSGQAL